MSRYAGSSRQRSTNPPTSNFANEFDSAADFRVATEIFLRDVEEFQSDRNQIGQSDVDEDVALFLSAADARSSIMIENDRALARAMQESETGGAATEAPIFAPTGRQVTAARRTLTRQIPAQHPPSTSSPAWGFPGWLVSLVSGMFSNLSSSTPETASTRLTGHDCVICRDPIRGVEIRAPCNHYYDRSCTVNLFQAATRDESLFPPRCCGRPIPLASVQSCLYPGLVTLFKEKEKEFGTLNRVYCANPKCSRFLGPVSQHLLLRMIITCSAPGCSTRTCNRCKNKVEGNLLHFCTTVQKDEELLALSKSKNWARCPGCDRMIELLTGCYHMTCRCKTQFCYLCSARWKTCRCTQWDDNRLLATAERQVDVQLAAERPRANQLRPLAEERVPPLQPIPPPIVLPVATPLTPGNQTPEGDTRSARVHRARTRRRQQTSDVPALEDTAVLYQNRIHQKMTVDPQRPPDLILEQPSTSRLTTTASSSRHAERYVRPGSCSQDTNAEEDALQAGRRSPRKRQKGRIHAPSPTQTDSAKWVPLRPRTEKRVGNKVVVDQERDKAQKSHLKKKNDTATTDRMASSSDTAHPSSTPSSSHPGGSVRPAHTHRSQLIQKTVAQLRVHPGCSHLQWKHRPGRGRCETCHRNFSSYLFRCAGCQTLSCNRCLRNRL